MQSDSLPAEALELVEILSRVENKDLRYEIFLAVINLLNVLQGEQPLADELPFPNSHLN